MEVHEIQAEKILSFTKIDLADYVINHYSGCQYGCVYCYAKFLKRHLKNKDDWGNFVNIKINALEKLKEQTRELKIDKVLIGSVTEVYQPIEKKYKLTRKVLKYLLTITPEIVLLTKSDLILRDIDLLKQFKKATIFYTVSSNNDNFINLLENNTPEYNRRLHTIKELKKNNINVWVHVGPVIPYITEIKPIINDVKKICSKIDFESLNMKNVTWPLFKSKLEQYDSSLIEKYKSIFFNKTNYYEYWNEQKKIIDSSLNKSDIKYKIFFYPFDTFF